MMARHASRSTTGASALLTLSLALAAGAAPLAAQQSTARRMEIVTHRAPRADGDSTERVVRRLKLRVDSLARLYNDDDALSAGERQRVGDELDRAVLELDRVSERMARAGASVRLRMEPMSDASAGEAISRILMQSGAATGGPRGWLGIVVNGVAREPRFERGELIVHYLSYPEIVSVEPSSPAQRAGLTPGDTLYAYDGRDVRDVDISMTRLLVPNARVLVRTGANGRMRDVPVTIADAPSRITLRAREMNAVEVGRSGTIAMSPRFPASTEPVRGLVGRSMVAVTAPLTPMAPTSMGVGGLAGAQMGSVTAEWAKMTGTSHGVLVMRVPVGSIAAESGLRDADVIVRAAGRTVNTLPELRSLLETAWRNGDHALAIDYVRERKTRSGTLRW